MTRTAFVFPGQGSQFVGMGREFYDAHDWARDLFALADEITGKPITRLCLEGPMDELTQTVNLQPALTVIDLVCGRALAEKGIKPWCTAGHSLGEYPALATAGVISIEDALRLVNLRGELMHREAQAKPGAMQAVIGLTGKEVGAICELARDRGKVVAANYNSPLQTVISGEGEAVATAAKFAKSKGGKALALPVSGAWHSPLMADAAKEFAEALEQVPFNAPAAKIFLNVTGTMFNDPVMIKQVMAKQIISPVKWVDIVFSIVASGVTHFIEAGPKTVLTGLAKKTITPDTEIELINVQNPAGVDQAVIMIGE